MTALGSARRCGFCLLAVLLSGLLAPEAQAIPLLNGFGGPAGYGPNNLPPNDDGSTGIINISGAFPMGLSFFGGVYTSMYVNNNGNITFRGALGQYTPAPFPVAMQPMIAPWWGDVDTRGGGLPARNGVWWYIEPNRVVVTWNNVGYYASHDDRQNDFQLILSTSATCTTGGDFDVEFRYNRCEWNTGDASGGMGGTCPGGASPMCTPAQVGFDAGNTRDFVSLPMSRTLAITEVCRTSNVPGGAPGLFRFQIRGMGIASGCMGSGAPCTVPGQMGVCGQGILQCFGMGTRCVQINRPAARRCNGFDNDCDGMVDTGDELCTGRQVCDRGSCVDRCEPELGCLPGRTCTMGGTCIETACIDVMCPVGQRCTGGMCVGVCDGVNCPHGQSCRAGRCVDPCAGVMCNTREVCENGLCVPGCQCRPCMAGSMCQPDGRCSQDDCVGVTCPSGTYCDRGMCRDSCETAPDMRLCPPGEVCMEGNCVPGRDPTPPRDGGTVTDGAVNPPDDSSVTPPRDGMVTPPPSDSGMANDAGRTAEGGVGTVLPRTRGCACRAGAVPIDARVTVLGWVFGLCALARRPLRRAKRALR